MNKTLVVIGGVLVAALPWFGGGRDAIALVITAFALLLAALFLLRQPNRKTTAGWILRLALTLWLAWGVLSIIWSANRFQSELWLLFSAIAVAVGVIVANLKKEDQNQLITGYVWSACVFAALGIFLFLTGEYGRLTTTFYWANPAAAYFIPALLIAVWRWVEGGRYFDAAAAGVLGVAFWLTDSRGGTLVLALAVITALVMSRRLRGAWKHLLILGVITFGIAYGLGAIQSRHNHTQVTLGSRYSEAAQGETTSTKDRWSYLQSAFAIWWQHPLLGTGAGTYSTVHPQYQQRVTAASSDVHNVYVQTLAEQGIVGAMLLAWVVLALLVGMLRSLPLHPERTAIFLGAVVMLLHMGLDIDTRYPALLVLLALLAASVYRPVLRQPVRGANQLALPILILTVLVLAVSFYRSDASAARGRIYDDSRDFTAAAAAFQKAHVGLMYDPDTWSAEGIDYFSLATLTNGSKTNLEKTRDRANHAIKLDPKDSQHYFLRARSEYLGNDLQAAEKDYRKALSLDRYNHAEYYQDLASLQLQLGDVTSAQRTVNQALALYPDSVVANRNADANMKPAVSQLLAFRAADDLIRGDQAAARHTLDRALQLNPLNRDALRLKQQLTVQTAL